MSESCRHGRLVGFCGHCIQDHKNEEEIKRLRGQIFTNRDDYNKRYKELIETTRLKIAYLEKQIDSMRCCGNCEIYKYRSVHMLMCDAGEPKSAPWLVCDKWVPRNGE